MFKCLKKSKAPIVKEPVKPINTIAGADNVAIGLVVGHNFKSQGAVNYLGESEYTFNKRIAKKVQEKLAVNGIRAVILERPVGSYSSQCSWIANKLVEFGVEFSVNLHFNCADSKAMGCEVLVAPSSSKLDDSYADYITDQLNEQFGFRERGQDGIRKVYKGHRGYGMLGAITKKGIPAVIVEPCFGNHRSKESILIFENEDKYVDVLANSLYKVARGEALNV